jgi:hypothetical protein
VGEFCVDLPEDTRPADVASFAPKEFAIKLDATLPDHRTNNNGRTLEAIG